MLGCVKDVHAMINVMPISTTGPPHNYKVIFFPLLPISSCLDCPMHPFHSVRAQRERRKKLSDLSLYAKSSLCFFLLTFFCSFSPLSASFVFSFFLVLFLVLVFHVLRLVNPLDLFCGFVCWICQVPLAFIPTPGLVCKPPSSPSTLDLCLVYNTLR
jgi:hypothetical protein